MIATDDFKCKIKDADVYGVADYLGVPEVDVFCGHPDVIVEFTIHPEFRDYGLKNIYVSIHAVTATINWEVLSDDYTPEQVGILRLKGGEVRNTGAIEGEIELDTEGWNIENDCTFQEDGSYSLDNIQIDFKEKTIIISN